MGETIGIVTCLIRMPPACAVQLGCLEQVDGHILKAGEINDHGIAVPHKASNKSAGLDQLGSFNQLGPSIPR